MAEGLEVEKGGCRSEISDDQVALRKSGELFGSHGRLPTYEETQWENSVASQQGISSVSSAASSRSELVIHNDIARPGTTRSSQSELQDIAAFVDSKGQSVHLSDRRKIAVADTTSGLARGAKSLVTEFGKGFTGIVTEPIKGAKQGGVNGFSKGLVRGSLGVVVRPVYGTCLFATHTWKGIRSDIALASVPSQRHTSPASTLDACREVQPKLLEDDHRLDARESGVLSGRLTTDTAVVVTLDSELSDTMSQRSSLETSHVVDEWKSSSHPSYREGSIATCPVEPSEPAPPPEESPSDQHDTCRREGRMVSIRESVMRMTDNRYSGVLETGRRAVIVKEGRPAKLG